jgi:glycerol uptake facilitator-like aquaporin
MTLVLSSGTDVLALLCYTLATGAILVVIITIVAPISGAHFNPAVTL